MHPKRRATSRTAWDSNPSFVPIPCSTWDPWTPHPPHLYPLSLETTVSHLHGHHYHLNHCQTKCSACISLQSNTAPVSLDYLGMETPYAQLDPNVVARKRQRREELEKKKREGMKDEEDEEEEMSGPTMVDDESGDEEFVPPPPEFQDTAKAGKSFSNVPNFSRSTGPPSFDRKWPQKSTPENETPKNLAQLLKTTPKTSSKVRTC